MTNIDFDEVEESLEIVVPDIYRMFVEAVDSKNIDLEKYGIYNDTQSIIKGNERLRENLSKVDSPWKSIYFDFGVGDGCGNYYFIRALSEDSGDMELWSHDPAGIEKVGKAVDFFKVLLQELELDFKGPNWSYFQGNGV